VHGSGTGTDQLIPVVHGTTYEEVRKVSPLLGSRHGLDTAEDSMDVIATKIAELVHIEDLAGVGRERSDTVV
jgi:hypothetical protein